MCVYNLFSIDIWRHRPLGKKAMLPKDPQAMSRCCLRILRQHRYVVSGSLGDIAVLPKDPKATSPPCLRILRQHGDVAQGSLGNIATFPKDP